MEKQEIRTFGRRHGKSLSARQQWLVENILPAISPKNIKNTGKIVLEIGFGAGEHLRDIAIASPDDIIIGAEPFMNGVASLMSAITDESDNSIKPEYKNIRIWPDDVRQLLQLHIAPGTLDMVYILHPDPWPKARHQKRRLLNANFLNLLTMYIKPDGKIIIGTDHHEYYDWIVEQLKNTKLKINTTDLKIIKTRYQQKNKAGTIAPKYLVLESR